MSLLLFMTLVESLQAATLSISANPLSVTSGAPSTITWSSSDATSCAASGAWSGVKATAGNQSVIAPNGLSTYALNCSGPSGSASNSVVIGAGTPPPALYALNVTLSGSGTVTSNPSGITCAATCSASYPSGAVVSLSATPAAGYTFSGWSGACSGSGACVATLSQARSVTANFIPDSASLTVGYNHTTRSVTAATVVLDLAKPSSGNYPVWVSGVGYPNLVRAATHGVLPGGHFGRGYSRFSPGHFTDGGRGEHYSGIGQIQGFNTVGDSSRMVVGQLVRFGSTFFTDQASPYSMNGDIKELILINDSGSRPMILTKGGVTRVLGACNGTTCNTTGSVANIDYHNDGNNLPNINAYLGQWLWVEFAFNSSAMFTRVRTWSADGTLQGAETIAPWASPGRVTTLDVIGFVNAIPVQGAQPYYDLERVEFRVGSDNNITPPVGFPGSAR